MESSLMRRIPLVILALSICCAPALAQKWEVEPYAGGLWLTNFNNVLDFRNPGIFGVKGGGYLTDHFMLEGNVGYLNQFTFGGYDYKSHGLLYEVAGSYNFFGNRLGGVFPFVTLGLGGLSVGNESLINGNDSNAAVYVVPLAVPVFTGSPIPRTLDALVVEDGDTFFNFSYGGGVKAARLWGPMGFRADVRGRTMPNFFGKTVNSFELTGGLLFSWGER